MKCIEDAAKDIALDTRVELAFPLFLPKQSREDWSGLPLVMVLEFFVPRALNLFTFCTLHFGRVHRQKVRKVSPRLTFQISYRARWLLSAAAKTSFNFYGKICLKFGVWQTKEGVYTL